MKNITEMNREEILALNPKDVDGFLTADEVVHIAKILGAFWSYDYDAAAEGMHGMHAELKSKRHSDGFFVSKILLEPENILKIMARQIVMRLQKNGVSWVDCVIGVPDGATKLGEEIAPLLRARTVKMEKIEGRIALTGGINDEEDVLIVEDFCTRGTGFKEAVAEIKNKHPETFILPWNPVIINRGGEEAIKVSNVPDIPCAFYVLPIVEKRVQDWDPADCQLCKNGSVAIKPKETDENWRKLIESQLSFPILYQVQDGPDLESRK